MTKKELKIRSLVGTNSFMTIEDLSRTVNVAVCTVERIRSIQIMSGGISEVL